MLQIQPVQGGGRFATKDTIQRGTNAEKRFATMCMQRGLKIRSASREENMYHHYDFVVTVKDGTQQSVDVKAMKSRRRWQKPDPTVIFVETKAVNGRRGWLYGCAEYIAFEQPYGFFMVPRKGLLECTAWLKQFCVPSTVSGIRMTVYGRHGRMDEVVVLSIQDIVHIPGSFLLRG